MARPGLYVQYGAGLCGPQGWVNFDVSPSLRLQRIPLVGQFLKAFGPNFPKTIRYGDIVRGLPIPDNSCDGIYCSHVLEHLSLDDFRTALQNTRRYLKDGARFRFVVPDLEHLARTYVDDVDHDAALKFMRAAHLGHESRARDLFGRLRSAFGNAAHLWMWDFKSISQELHDAGFASIRRAALGDSGDPSYDLVEDRGRWIDCLGVDCLKPGGYAGAQRT